MSADPVWSGRGRDGSLLGRDTELDRMSLFLGDAARHGAALLLTGEPGVGKSALLEAAVQQTMAAGGQVARASGLRTQTAVAFSGLDQLVTPLRAHLAYLSPSFRTALTVALGLTGGRPAGFSVVANAALGLFDQAAAGRPLLVAVDDAHWLDPPSASVLSFLARRLSGTRVGFLAASRTEICAVLDGAGLPELEVHALAPGQAAALLDTRFPLLAPAVQQRLLVEAAGNPLALVELPALLSPHQQSGRDPLPEALPLNARLEAVFDTELDALPDPSRDLLLMLALEGSGDLGLLQAATRGADLLPLLAPAERARLVFVDAAARRASFRHPLVAAAVRSRSLPLERRRTHQQLAEVLPVGSERRAWHLAEASAEPTEAVALLLDDAARRSKARGDVRGAVTALTRAAQLSADGQAQGRRLLTAAHLGASLTGEVNLARQLLEDAVQTDPQLVASLPASLAAANLLLNDDCQIDAAHRLLTAALRAHHDRRDAYDETLVDALHSLLTISWLGGRPELWDYLQDRLADLRPAAPPLLDLGARSLGDPVREGAAGLARLDDTVGRLAEVRDPVEIIRTGAASLYTDRLRGCRSALQRVVEEGQAGGAVAPALHALMWRAIDEWQCGHWDDALSLSEAGLTLSRRYGYGRYTFVLSGYLQALVRAARGDHDHSLDAAQQMLDWARPRGAGIAVSLAHHIELMAAQGNGDFERAFRAAAAISPPGVLAPYAPHALWVLLDLVEAAERTDRHAEAEAHVDAIHAAQVAQISPRLRLVATACSALVARGAEARDNFAAALAVPGAAQWRFDHARVQLAYGEHLGQTRAVAEARDQLHTALGTFRSLGARPWVDRTQWALRVTGLSSAPDGTRWLVTLTPAELEVADLAASGLTNKQIGQRLFLSPRTVSDRLYQLFPKLGITTRAALRDALFGLDPARPCTTQPVN